MKPNIFDIATKELSQDAFFTWLSQWADPSNEKYNRELHSCSKEFLKMLMKNKIYEGFKINKVITERQWENIDICVEVNDKYLIIIEDKTFTGEHSDQLDNYKKIATRWCKKNNYELICIYLKTGSEAKSSLDIISKKGYNIVSRKELMEFFGKYKINNDVFNDFVQHIYWLEKLENAYETKKIQDWDGNCWIGFFKYLELHDELLINGWSYVNNPSGGFLGMWWNGYEWKRYWVYLQIEEYRLCFKICGMNKNHSKIRNDFFDVIMTKAEKMKKNEIKKPVRFGKGKYMTVAIVDQENWLGKGNDILDKKKVVEKLKEYDKFLKNCVK